LPTRSRTSSLRAADSAHAYRPRRSQRRAADEWTVRELSLIEQHYGRMPRRELIARYLPNRTLKAVEHRAGLLGVCRKVKPAEYWAPAEIEVLRRYYGTMPRKELIALYMPNRSIKQLDYKVGELGLRQRRPATKSWSARDLTLLRQHYGTMPNVALRSRYFPHVSISAIGHRALRLGLRSKEPNWTTAEDRLIKRHYGRVPNPAFAARSLPGRTAEAVQSRAAKLGLTRAIQEVWSAKELRLLRKHYPTHTVHEMSRYLPSRTVAAIRARVTLEGLQRKQRIAWTAPELALIRQHYEAKNGLQRLVRKLVGRTPLSIQQQARKLHLSRAGNPWTAHDDALLRRLYPRHGLKTRIPNHTPGSMRVHAQKLGLRIRPRER
jgi:hypothetical protein